MCHQESSCCYVRRSYSLKNVWRSQFLMLCWVECWLVVHTPNVRRLEVIIILLCILHCFPFCLFSFTNSCHAQECLRTEVLFLHGTIKLYEEKKMSGQDTLTHDFALLFHTAAALGYFREITNLNCASTKEASHRVTQRNHKMRRIHIKFSRFNVLSSLSKMQTKCGTGILNFHFCHSENE